MFSHHMDPGRSLGIWKESKILRGLLRHPERKVRVAACWQLALQTVQDECVNTLTNAERNDLASAGFNTSFFLAPRERNEAGQRSDFARLLLEISSPQHDRFDVDLLRTYTTINNKALRREFCQKFMPKFPNDTDNGCPADKPLPATIVTENGDVPLVGPWPK